MEGFVAKAGLEWPRFAWIKKFFVKRPVDIYKILALHEAEKRLDKLHSELSERLIISRML